MLEFSTLEALKMENNNVFQNYAKIPLSQEKIDIYNQNLPDEMKSEADFGFVKVATKKDSNGKTKIAKVPCNEHGNPICGYKNGRSYSEVAKPNQNATGLSLVLDGNNSYFCLDIDKCTKNGIIDPAHKCAELIKELVYGLNTYTEHSISTNGLHIIGKVFGGMPESITRTRNEYVELYHIYRIIALTGNRVDGTPKSIRSFSQQQMIDLAEILGLGDKPSFKQVKCPESYHINKDYSQRNYEVAENPTVDYVIEKVCSYPNSRELFEGSWKNTKYSSKSEADEAFAYFSAIHSNCDKQVIKEVMYRSNLYEEDLNTKNKWERDDYLDNTIDNAVNFVCKQNPKMILLVKDREQQKNQKNEVNNGSPF